MVWAFISMPWCIDWHQMLIHLTCRYSFLFYIEALLLQKSLLQTFFTPFFSWSDFFSWAWVRFFSLFLFDTHLWFFQSFWSFISDNDFNEILRYISFRHNLYRYSEFIDKFSIMKEKKEMRGDLSLLKALLLNLPKN